MRLGWAEMEVLLLGDVLPQPPTHSSSKEQCWGTEADRRGLAYMAQQEKLPLVSWGQNNHAEKSQSQGGGRWGDDQGLRVANICKLSQRRASTPLWRSLLREPESFSSGPSIIIWWTQELQTSQALGLAGSGLKVGGTLRGVTSPG